MAASFCRLLAFQKRFLPGGTAGELVKQRHAVGLGPEPDHSAIAEGGILDFEQRPAVEADRKAAAGKIDPQVEPLVCRHCNPDAIAAAAPDDIERAADTLHGLVENDVVLKRVGTSHVVVVRVPGAPDKAGGAILTSCDRLEHRCDIAILDVGVVVEKQWKGCAAGLFYDV